MLLCRVCGQVVFILGANCPRELVEYLGRRKYGLLAIVCIMKVSSVQCRVDSRKRNVAVMHVLTGMGWPSRFCRQGD